MDYIRTKKGLDMKLSESVKSISYLKANAATLIDDINKNQKTFVITQNGEAKVVVQDIKMYEKMLETMAMLKLLAMTSEKSKKAADIKGTFKALRNELKSVQ
jgi:prevent-host-death family protein